MRYAPLLRWIAVVAFLVLAARGEAQCKFERAQQFTVEDGLPGNQIRFIQKSRDGFVWIGTEDGLCRFDGAQFKVYQHDPEDPNSIIDNRTICMAVDSHELWIGTHVGLSRLDLLTEKFTSYQFDEKGRLDLPNRDAEQQVHSLLIDRDGELWVGARYWGLARYIREKDDFEMFRGSMMDVAKHFPEPRSIHNILSLEQHRFNDSIIWAGTPVGLLEINKYTHSLQWLAFNLEIPVEKRWGNTFKNMYHHHDGLVYVGNWGGGMTIFDPDKRFVKVMDGKGQPGADILKAATHSIREKGREEFWITSTTGLACYHSGRKEIVFFRKNDEGQTYGVDLIDENNRAWVRSGQGVFVYDPLLQQFDAYSFQDLNEGFRGMAFNLIEDTLTHTLLVAPRSTQGVFHYSLENGAWEKSEIPEDFLDDGGQFAATDAAMSPEGELTVCYKGGILRYDPETKKIRAFPVLPPIKQRHFTSLLWDSRGRLWMTTFNEGICRWDPSTQRWRVFQEEVRSDDPNLLSMSFNYLMEDSRGNIWFKREKGFGLYLTDRDTFLQVLYTLQPERCFPHINNLVEDKRGRVWMNFTDGIVGYAEAAHPENGVVRKMDLNEQPNIHIKGIWALRVDRHGDIWGWGVKALTKIDGDDISVSQYNFRYGEDDPNFYSFEILSAGELVFGGSNRIVIVHPEELRYNQEAPQPYLTGINILEESYDGSVAPLNTKELRLKHWQNFFSFDFSARGFTFGKQNQFRYRLHGFDENWILAKGRRNANYTNVPTGEYRFQLQAANNEGVWNETLFELPVAITSPWWKRWWFISALILSGSLLGYRMYLFRVRQIRKEEKLKAEFEKRLADVEMSALRAQMNPHFLFNSLNSIDSFIIRNETQKASEYLNNFARLIRLILQNSRSNYVSLKDEVEAIELYLQMENLRFRDKFTYEVRIDECIELSSIDIPPMLIQPYIENAIWHGLMHKEDKSQGKVTFSVAKENGFLQCVIEDNGIGREQAKELNARRPLRGRQSYGMRITSDRINMINKLYNSNTSVRIIDLKDGHENPLGTRVELCIPV